MSDAAFGVVTTAADIEAAVVATLQEWFSTYLRMLERHTGRESKSLPDIGSWRAADTMAERFPEQQLPALQVMIGTDADLYTGGDKIQGTFKGTVDILVQSTEPERARELAQLYAYAAGLLLAQHQNLDGSVDSKGMQWDKYGAPAAAKQESRWLAIGSAEIVLLVDGIGEPLKGPAVPEEEPPEYGKVEHHHVILDAVDPSNREVPE